MIACVLIAAPKLRPPAGMPPITPGSAVSVSRSITSSSVATSATPSGMPMPRLTTLLGLSSSAARRAMILRSLIAIGSTLPAGTRISPANAALYGSANVCMWYSGFSATTISMLTDMPTLSPEASAPFGSATSISTAPRARGIATPAPAWALR